MWIDPSSVLPRRGVVVKQLIEMDLCCGGQRDFFARKPFPVSRQQQLERRGVPFANLAAAAGSQSDMLVPTQDREPQNRRIQICFRK
jgi:hypothetical protein